MLELILWGLRQSGDDKQSKQVLKYTEEEVTKCKTLGGTNKMGNLTGHMGEKQGRTDVSKINQEIQ